MKIIAPVNNQREAEALLEAGAHAVYCGVTPYSWIEKYPTVVSPNRRARQSANLASYNELQEIVDLAHSKDAFVYLTLNSICCTERQYPLIFEQVEKAKKVGVDALIVCDVGILLTIRNKGIDLDIHLSTGGASFNSHTVKFYEELGASRIILPTQLQMSEIEKIVKDFPAIKFEVFILNSGCKDIDCFCMFLHGLNDDRRFPGERFLKRLFLRKKHSGCTRTDACTLDYEISLISSADTPSKETEKVILQNIKNSFNEFFKLYTCGVCRAAEFDRMGIYGMKISGRGYPMIKKIKDVRFLKAVVSHIKEQAFGEKEFSKYVQDTFKQVYGMNCSHFCYYPERI